jgi:hypothetical protein
MRQRDGELEFHYCVVELNVKVFSRDAEDPSDTPRFRGAMPDIVTFPHLLLPDIQYSLSVCQKGLRRMAAAPVTAVIG